ncbi:MAG: SHOCT domain-containing protein [Chloroflexi bacterium]|nr:SHOCT domain-containing protein [Chloroflexota bacterium]
MFGFGPGMMDDNFGFGMMNGFGGIGTILFWIVIVGLGIWLVSRLASHANSQPPSNGETAPESALDILKKRYARGEISKEQFGEMRRNVVE